MKQNKLNTEGSKLVSNTNQLKMKAKDGKTRETDTLNTKGILRLIKSVPSRNAEPFKLWLADLGKVTTKNLVKYIINIVLHIKAFNNFLISST